MYEQINRFFMKNNIQTDTIKYLLRKDRKTVVYLLDGRTPSTNLPLKELLEALPDDKFLNIQKGIVVSISQITDISDSGVYTMSDGCTFQGRRRSLKAHKDVRQTLAAGSAGTSAPSGVSLSLLEKCTIFDRLPVAVCLIELISDDSGNLIDFVFRYCNQEMEDLEKVPVNELIGRTLRETFPNANYQKLIAYADVALNGTNRIANSYSFVNNEPQKVFCYQPEKGFCICLIAKDADLQYKLYQ